MLDHLIQWVQEYETRDDEYGLKRHRQVFDRFSGPKHEYTSTASMNPRLNFVVQHLLGLKEALIRCFVAMSFSRSTVEVFGD